MAKLSKAPDVGESCYSHTRIHSDHSRLPSDLATNKRTFQHPEQNQRNKLQQPKGPAYWDNLTTIYLTKGALTELDRRNSYNPEYHRLDNPQLGWSPQFAPDFLRGCTSGCLKELGRLSRHGGPDLSDLRNHPEPKGPLVELMDLGESTSQTQRAPLPLLAQDLTSKKITATTTYSRNFLQHLVDHAIYPSDYEYPDGESPGLPKNWEDINERLGRRRPSLSASKFSQEDFRIFRRNNAHMSRETPAIESVVPIIEGDIGNPKCRGGGYPFGNFDHLTDGTLSRAVPDRFYGAFPGDLDRQIRMELSKQIIPSTQDKAKGLDGSLAVAELQACYDGALGARGIDALRFYKQERLIYDNNAYTITSTYHGGALRLFTTHIAQPKSPGSRPEYIMTLLGGWLMTNSPETFRQGAAAYRNARDWAKETRDELIRLANRRQLKAQSQPASTAPQLVAMEGPVFPTQISEESQLLSYPGEELEGGELQEVDNWLEGMANNDNG